MVGEAFPFSVKISNHTTLAQDFYVRVADTDNFLIAGEKKAQFTTNPGTTYCLDYVLFPLVPGRVGLPKFDVTALRNNMKLTKPTAAEQFVFVRPLLGGPTDANINDFCEEIFWNSTCSRPQNGPIGHRVVQSLRGWKF
jgi:hypothetical protein